jgi:glycosyltransferase involved in cell wall biosynthesis
MVKIVIIGPGHPLRGGLATFDQRLAKEFIQSGDDCSICSFSLQYPRIFFPGKTQYSEEPAPEGIVIRSLINSINPINWLKVGNQLRKESPDIIIVRFWIPFMGPAFGTILRRVRKNKHTKIICIADNIIPHEHHTGDRTFTKYFLKSCDAFITMSEKVMNDLRFFEKEKTATIVQHPLYDNFGEAISKEDARKNLSLPTDEKIILFFGFIRNYKGLDILLRSMADERIRSAGIKLMVAGEFYEDKNQYLELISKLEIKDQLILKTDFIPDSEVRNYLCAADVVTPLAYHFEKPMVVTNVGGLPSLVQHEKVGLVAEPDPTSIADSILRFYQLGENYFIPHLRTEKQKYSWSNLVNAITKLAEGITGRIRE